MKLSMSSRVQRGGHGFGPSSNVSAPSMSTREIIVVDDGSSDGRGIWRALPAAPDLVRLYHEGQSRQRGALRTGFAAATGEVVVVRTPESEYDPNEYIKMLVPIATAAPSGLRIPIRRRRVPPCPVFLALARQPVPDAPVEAFTT